MHSPIQGPLGRQRALLTLRAQAHRWLEAYRADLGSRGLGFTADDVTALQTAKAAMDGWTERIEDDAVIATMYGRLFSQAGDLPLKA